MTLQSPAIHLRSGVGCDTFANCESMTLCSSMCQCDAGYSELNRKSGSRWQSLSKKRNWLGGRRNELFDTMWNIRGSWWKRRELGDKLFGLCVIIKIYGSTGSIWWIPCIIKCKYLITLLLGKCLSLWKMKRWIKYSAKLNVKMPNNK